MNSKKIAFRKYKNSLFQYLAGTKIRKTVKHANFIQEQGRIKSFICNDTKRHPVPISLSLNTIKQTSRLI